MQAKEIISQLRDGAFNGELARIYCCSETELTPYIERLEKAVSSFEQLYGTGRDLYVFSAPGRTEVCGNHTDHQNGMVLAASVTLDVIAIVALSDQQVIRLKSEGYPEDVVDISNSEATEKQGSSSAIIKGIASKFGSMGYSVGGFDAYTTSDVLGGSGLSSSAAFEVLVGTIINHLFCSVQESPLTIAQIGQYAENVFFGKPSGLMDQAASSIGGFIKIDFKDTKAPAVESISFDLEKYGYALCIIDTHGSHANLTPDYAAIPAEMRKVAAFFGKQLLREVDPNEFYGKIAEARKAAGDRAVLRAMHFFADNQRVDKEFGALRKGDFDEFLQLTIESGRSSFCYLQNVFSTAYPDQQGVSFTLAMCERLLRPKKGAWRVHGGGFAGTVQTFVPVGYLPSFMREMDAILGEGSCHHLKIRPVGGIRLI